MLRICGLERPVEELKLLLGAADFTTLGILLAKGREEEELKSETPMTWFTLLRRLVELFITLRKGIRILVKSE